MSFIPIVGQNLRAARKRYFPQDDMKAFALRLGVSRATLQKMEHGDLSVTFNNYYKAGTLLGLTSAFENLFVLEESLFDD